MEYFIHYRSGGGGHKTECLIKIGININSAQTMIAIRSPSTGSSGTLIETLCSDTLQLLILLEGASNNDLPLGNGC